VEISNWVLIAIGVFLFALYLSNVAGRLDRLHLKVENARNALDRQLALRSAICSDIAGLDLLDATLRSRLANAIHASISEKYPNQKNLIQETAGATRRVQYALTFYNDAARSAIKVRRRWLVRSFRLFGRASMPVLIDFDDQIPQGLEFC
jgi:hypothetical protein